ncbi:hypothetical protein LTR10_003631 [Elasticomyces elasticus]|nr:hypothetical protein LTR10_003631 [Elasticomyces elasticus]KAK4978175.1 hypothetical protein LTR42_002553 [Elasticomyces elasticus]
MPTFSSRLTYALEVNASDLIAAIEVDVQFRAIVQTLQLCNIFGATATITKLPTELIDLVEEHIAANKLEAIAQRQHEVKKLYLCAEGECNSFHHLSDSEQLTRVNEALKERSEDEAESVIAESEIMYVMVPRLIERFGLEERKDLLDRHAMNVGEWRQLVGKAGMVDCGLFGKHSKFVRRYYGLEVFVANSGREGRWRTSTNLILPNDKANRSATEVERFDERRECQKVSPGAPCEKWAPEEPTEDEKALFTAMLTGLAMPGWESRAGEDEKQRLRARAAPRLSMLTYIRIRK